jgi:chromosome segregation ATPase
MPKREFIPNVDDANAELARLDGQIETLTTSNTKATNDLKAANDLMTEATTNLETATAEVTDLRGQIETLKTENAGLKQKANSATTTIAKARVTTAVSESASASPTGEPVKPELKGLQRAIAARTQQLAAQTGGAQK